MTDTQQDTSTVTWVAIDIAKRWNAVLVEYPDGRRQSFKMANQREDYDRLVVFLRTQPGTCRVALEATADYHRLLAYRLVSEGLNVCFVSSVAGARYREARFNSWDKNDPKDAEVILALLKQGLTQHYHDAVIHGIHDWQELSKTYLQISRARTRLQHSLLTHYLTLYFPEMERFWCTTRNDWFITFLLQFPTPASIAALDQEAFIQAAWAVVGRRVNKRGKLAEIYGLAQQSIGLPVTRESAAVATFRMQLARYQALNHQRAELEASAEQLLAGHPDYARLLTVPGIGPILALIILAEAGDLRRFGHHRQFLKYCGLDLAKSQSGAHRGRERLSKRGNARLRCALWMAALRALRMTENGFRDKYERYIRANPTDADLKRKAYTAVSAKMARVVYALIKTGTDYRGRFECALPRGSIPLSGAVEANRTS